MSLAPGRNAVHPPRRQSIEVHWPTLEPLGDGRRIAIVPVKDGRAIGRWRELGSENIIELGIPGAGDYSLKAGIRRRDSSIFQEVQIFEAGSDMFVVHEGEDLVVVAPRVNMQAWAKCLQGGATGGLE